MQHQASAEDEAFRRAFEAFAVLPDDFSHEAHLRLAYVYLCRDDRDLAAWRMKSALLAFLDHLGGGRAKYNETMTGAWIDAVAHFMDRTPACACFADFIAKNPVLRDSNILLTHYSAERLFSDRARAEYLEPDIQPIPGRKQ
ncbi:hypothetical protein GCM10011348_20890 [Marinobacterium nitratireducens]|uniref:Uncharacterized protein n=1 Tax=Marinobacterium nitratireducens TaxID=518897 RepID=A0A917ZGG1_9GAMM|nr:hypothetical protein [Marinobacterium nitratireducens]GGO81579.1 hypothetical protein GCM10011348_20890 [Marinobacterium nitratireducens]